MIKSIEEDDFMESKVKIAFNTQFVSSLTGASVSQLSKWDKIGLISPSILKAEGKGTIRLYSYEDIVEAKTVVHLRNNKHSLSQIYRAVKYIKENFPYNKPLKDLALLSNGIDIIFTDKNINQICSNWISASRNGQLVMEFVVPFGCLVDEINNIIDKYNKRIEEAEKEYLAGETISWDSIKGEYGISDRIDRKRKKRRSA